jgi:quercetin dioxygenase-like cupin family protein
LHPDFVKGRQVPNELRTEKRPKNFFGLFLCTRDSFIDVPYFSAGAGIKQDVVEVADMSSQQAQGKREMPFAEVVRLLDLVSYQEGSVVSRTLVNRTTGTVTLFAFDEGQGLSEHTAPFDAVAHVLEGESEITVSGKPLRTTAGEAVLLPANQPHSLKALGKFKMLLTMIRS